MKKKIALNKKKNLNLFLKIILLMRNKNFQILKKKSTNNNKKKKKKRQNINKLSKWKFQIIHLV